MAGYVEPALNEPSGRAELISSSLRETCARTATGIAKADGAPLATAAVSSVKAVSVTLEEVDVLAPLRVDGDKLDTL